MNYVGHQTLSVLCCLFNKSRRLSVGHPVNVAGFRKNLSWSHYDMYTPNTIEFSSGVSTLSGHLRSPVHRNTVQPVHWLDPVRLFILDRFFIGTFLNASQTQTSPRAEVTFVGRRTRKINILLCLLLWMRTQCGSILNLCSFSRACNGKSRLWVVRTFGTGDEDSSLGSSPCSGFVTVQFEMRPFRFLLG